MKNRKSWEQLQAVWPSGSDPIEFAVDRDAELATIVCRKHPTIAQWTRVLASMLTDPGWKASHDLLIDYSCAADDRQPFLAEAIRYTAAQRGHFAGRLAIVAPDGPVADGLAAAILALPPARRNVQVFQTTQAAAAWLGFVQESKG